MPDEGIPGERDGGSHMRALLIIDMLNDFVQPGAPLEVPGARGILPRIRDEISKARRRSTPVMYVCDRHAPNDPEFSVWPPHAVKGTSGAAVVPELAPQPGDPVIAKTTYSGFFDTSLETELKARGVQELTLTGVCTEICVLYTAVDGLMRGYRIAVPPDAVAGLTEEDHRFALRQLREVLKPRRTV